MSIARNPSACDVLEGEAMLAAARKHKRVVQIGTQRKSTPHLIDAKKQVVEAGLLGKVGHVEMCCYFHMRANGNPPLEPVPDYLDYEMWTGPAPLRPYDGLPHRRWWRTFMEYGNGIMGDMCVHMFDTARWMLEPRLAQAHQLGRRHLRAEGGQVEHLRHADRHLRIRRFQLPSGSTALGARRPIRIIRGRCSSTARKARSRPAPCARTSSRTTRRPSRIHFDCLFEREQYPEDVTEKDIELNAAPATRRHMLDFLAAIEKRSRPVADIEARPHLHRQLHPGQRGHGDRPPDCL